MGMIPTDPGVYGRWLLMSGIWLIRNQNSDEGTGDNARTPTEGEIECLLFPWL